MIVIVIANNTNLYHHRPTKVIIDIITVNTCPKTFQVPINQCKEALYRISLGYSKSLDSRKTKEKKKRKQQPKQNKQKQNKNLIRIIMFGHAEYLWASVKEWQLMDSYNITRCTVVHAVMFWVLQFGTLPHWPLPRRWPLPIQWVYVLCVGQW